MDYFIKKICNRVTNIYNGISLYYLYFVGLVIVVIVVIAFKFDNEIQTILQLLGFLLILIPAIADLCRVAINMIKNKAVKSIIIIVPFSYIIYGVAEIISKEHIYSIVNFIPDSYTTAIYSFKLFYMLCILTIVFMFFMTLLLSVYCIFLTLKDIKFIQNTLNKLEEYVLTKFGFKNKIHMTTFWFLGVFTIFLTIDTILKTPTLYFYKYAPMIIHYTSYYQNNTICPQINKEYYIKTLGDNKASISPFIGKINDNMTGQYNKYTHIFFIFAYRENKEIGQNFITKQCD